MRWRAADKIRLYLEDNSGKSAFLVFEGEIKCGREQYYWFLINGPIASESFTVKIYVADTSDNKKTLLVFGVDLFT